MSFLSWNLAMFERSAEAPPDWTQEHTEAEVREIVLERSPDLVVLQELPGLVPYVETHDMIRANPRSHSGNLATLVGNDLMEERLTHSVVRGCALLVTFVDRGLTVANVHLAPGPGNAAHRLTQLRAVIGAAPTRDLVVVGDTNTRTDEEAGIEAIGLWGRRPPEPTWDGKRNRFRTEGAEFLAYFTRYFASEGVTVTDLWVRTEPVDVGGTGFHLSDHFALEGSIVTDSSSIPARSPHGTAR